MTGSVCLQGGAEFSPGCREMDAELVRLAAGPVVVTALAGAAGREYASANANGVRHFREVGGADVTAAPDVREDPSGALAVLRRARLLVLPGGSPARLLLAVQSTEVGQVVADLLAADGLVMGSSAGAMVLAPWTVLPDLPGPAVEPGLAAVPDVLVVPHWTGTGRRDWLDAVARSPASGLEVLGLPEQSGVLWRDGGFSVLGRSPVRRVTAEVDVPPGDGWRPLSRG